MFEKGGKNKMPARDLGALLRCLGWNPSERELEEVKNELVVSCKYDVKKRMKMHSEIPNSYVYCCNR